MRTASTATSLIAILVLGLGNVNRPLWAQLNAGYTFTLIDQDYDVPLPSGLVESGRFDVLGATLNDSGTAAYTYRINIGLPTEAWVRTGSGGPPVNVYRDLTWSGSGPSLSRNTAIDDNGNVYIVDNVFGTGPENPCPGFQGECLFDTAGLVRLGSTQPIFSHAVRDLFAPLGSPTGPLPRVIRTDFGLGGIMSDVGTLVQPGLEFVSVTGTFLAINQAGEVPFVGQANGGPSGVFVAKIGRPTRLVFAFGVGNGLGISSSSDPVIDDAGTVYVVTSYVSRPDFDVLAFPANGAAPTTLVDGLNGRLKLPSAVQANTAGRIVFMARLDDPNSGPLGIYTGPDPMIDKVIAVGDPFDGSTVTDLQMPQQMHAINNNPFGNRAQILFAATLADGRRGLYRANPPTTSNIGGAVPVFGFTPGAAPSARRRPPR